MLNSMSLAETLNAAVSMYSAVIGRNVTSQEVSDAVVEMIFEKVRRNQRAEAVLNTAFAINHIDRLDSLIGPEKTSKLLYFILKYGAEGGGDVVFSEIKDLLNEG